MAPLVGRTLALATVGSVYLGAVPVSAHHSLAVYDRDTLRTIDGVVKDYDFANPHVQLSLTVMNVDGSRTDWLFEASSVSRMMARGFNRVSAWPGAKIRVRYNPLRSGGAGGYLTGFTDSRGRTYGPIQER
jgi:hypothetical protein